MYAIGALFPEYTQILVRDTNDIRRILGLTGKRVYVGAPKSGSHRNALDILAAHGLGPDDLTLVETAMPAEDPITALLGGQVDAVITTSHERFDLDESGDHPVRLLSIDQYTREVIRRQFPFYEFTRVKTVEGDDIDLLFTRAILVARDPGLGLDLSEDAVAAFAGAISRHLDIRLARVGKRDFTLFKGQQIVHGIPWRLHPGAESYFTEQGFVVNLVPLVLWIIVLLTTLAAVVTSQVSSQWAALFRFRTHLSSPLRKVGFYFWKAADWIGQRPVLVTVLIMVAALSILFLLILLLENRYSLDTGVRNDFAGRSGFELFIWIVSISSMGGLSSQDIFQNSVLGRGLAAFVPFVSYGSALFLFIHHLVKKSQLRDKEEQGLSVPQLKDHIVLCGWNSRAPSIIREIIAASEWVVAKTVVVIARFDMERPLKQYEFRSGFVYYYRGISSDYEALRAAHVEDASGILVLADPSKLRSRNTRGLMTVVGIRRFLADRAKPVVCELHYADNYENFRQCGATKILPLEKVTGRLMLHACMNPGISDVLSNILSTASREVALLVRVADDAHLKRRLVGSTFKQASVDLRTERCLLVAVYRHDTQHVHSESELEFHPTTSPYIINPVTPADQAYAIHEQDQLVVLRSVPSFADARPFGANLEPCRGRSLFGRQPECVLVIGDRPSCSDVVSGLRPYCDEVIHVSASPPSTTAADSGDTVTRFTLPDLSHAALRAIFQSHPDVFGRVTRAVLFAPGSDPQLSTGMSQDGVYEDDFVMALALAVRALYKELFAVEKLHIVAELRNDTNIDLFHDLGIQQPVPTNRIIELTLARMAYFGGRVSELLLKTLSYSRANTKARLEKRLVTDMHDDLQGALVGLGYDQLIPELLERNLQLLAIKKVDGRIIMNPAPNSDDATEALTSEDCLFVFCTPVIPADS